MCPSRRRRREERNRKKEREKNNHVLHTFFHLVRNRWSTHLPRCRMLGHCTGGGAIYCALTAYLVPISSECSSLQLNFHFDSSALRSFVPMFSTPSTAADHGCTRHWFSSSVAVAESPPHVHCGSFSAESPPLPPPPLLPLTRLPSHSLTQERIV